MRQMGLEELDQIEVFLLFTPILISYANIA